MKQDTLKQPTRVLRDDLLGILKFENLLQPFDLALGLVPLSVGFPTLLVLLAVADELPCLLLLLKPLAKPVCTSSFPVALGLVFDDG